MAAQLKKTNSPKTNSSWLLLQEGLQEILLQAKDRDWCRCTEMASPPSDVLSRLPGPRLEDSNRNEENTGTEEHSHLRSLLMSKACYFAQQLHYYPSILFGREFRVSFYRFMLFALNPHWEMEINRQEGREHYMVLSERNFVLNQSIWERYDH